MESALTVTAVDASASAAAKSERKVRDTAVGATTGAKFLTAARNLYTGNDGSKDITVDRVTSTKGIDELQLMSKEILYSQRISKSAPSSAQSLKKPDSNGKIEDNLGAFIEQLQQRMTQAITQEFISQEVKYEVILTADLEACSEVDVDDGSSGDTLYMLSSSEDGSCGCNVSCGLS